VYRLDDDVQAYWLDLLAFFVAEPLVQRAFHDTYGVDLNDLFKDFHRAIESFRRAVSKTIPMATRIAWAEKKNQIERSQPGITRQKFIYIMSRP